ncbi:MAG: sigma-70 family RNA polymerase sigma factor [Pirellulaceae bacterium]
MRLEACEEFLLSYVKARLPSELSRHVGVSDIVQSVLFVVSRQQQVFRGTTDAEFRAWVCRIAQNKIIDGIRRYRSRKATAAKYPDASASWRGTVDSETPSTCVSLQEDARQLIEAIGQLPDDVRRIVNLRYAEGRTFEQIAHELHIPISTCRRRWFEGCHRLRQQLQAIVE